MKLHGLQGWRPLNGRPQLCVAVWLKWLQARVCGFSQQPIGRPGLHTAGWSYVSLWTQA